MPVWTPDGRTIVYSCTRGAPTPPEFVGTGYWAGNLWSVPADGSGGPQRLSETTESQVATAVTPDGGTIIYTRELDPPTGTGSTKRDIKRMPSVPGAEPDVLITGASRNEEGVLSPDGRWLAYQSDESGEAEIYVRAFPGLGARVPVSIDGGRFPAWSRAGGELFYRRGDGVWMSAMMAEGERPECSHARPCSASTSSSRARAATSTWRPTGGSS